MDTCRGRNHDRGAVERMAYALFIRVWVVAPQIRHSLTRYGSRENSAFSVLSLSVRIRTLTEWGVSRPQSAHVSDISAPSLVVAILSSTGPENSINTANR